MKRVIVIVITLAFIAVLSSANAQMFAMTFGNRTSAWTPAELNPIAWWAMDDNAANTTVISSAGSNTGTAQRNTSTIHTTGKTGGALTFNGSSDYVDVGSIEFERTNSFSFAAWIYTDAGSNYNIINNENSGYRGYSLLKNSNGNLTFGLRGTLGSSYFFVRATNSVLTSNEWVHVVSTYNGSSSASGAKLYINSVCQNVEILGDNLTTTTISGFNTLIGKRMPLTVGYLNGKIDDPMIFGRELTQAEITKLYTESVNKNGKAW